MRGAVHARALDDVPGQRGDVVAQQVDRQRQAEGRVREPDPKVGLGLDAETFTDLVVQSQQWNQRHLQRHDKQPDDDDEQPLAAGKIHPAEGVGGKRRDQDRDEGRRNRHLEGIQERLADAFGGDHLFIVLRQEDRRRSGDEEDANAGVFLVGPRQFQAIGAVGGDRQRAVRLAVLFIEDLTVGHFDLFARSELAWRGGLERELADLHARLLGEQPSADDVLVALRDDALGAAGAPHVSTGLCGQRGPPAARDQLRLVAKTRHQQAEGRHHPHQDDGQQQQLCGDRRYTEIFLHRCASSVRNLRILKAITGITANIRTMASVELRP